MQQDIGVSAISRVIELAIAPVFLLSAIGAILGVMTNRLARIIDRARRVEAQDGVGDLPIDLHTHPELITLSHRAKLISRAITLCTATAVLICSVIVALFLGATVHVDVSGTVAVLFILAMLCFLGGLVSLLREISLATASLRFGPHQVKARRSRGSAA